MHYNKINLCSTQCMNAGLLPGYFLSYCVFSDESFTFSIQTNSLFTIDEDGLHSEHCDNLYYESRPNMTSNSVEYPLNCSLLDESVSLSRLMFNFNSENGNKHVSLMLFSLYV